MRSSMSWALTSYILTYTHVKDSTTKTIYVRDYTHARMHAHAHTCTHTLHTQAHTQTTPTPPLHPNCLPVVRLKACVPKLCKMFWLLHCPIRERLFSFLLAFCVFSCCCWNLFFYPHKTDTFVTFSFSCCQVEESVPKNCKVFCIVPLKKKKSILFNLLCILFLLWKAFCFCSFLLSLRLKTIW